MQRLIEQVSAEVVTPRFRALGEGQVQEKNPGDLVTVADREAEVLLTRALTAAYPDALVLGEEAVAERPGLVAAYAAADHAFTIDPVDGTQNFVHGSPDHAVMVSESRGAQVVRSWIWQPQHRLAYVAERGAGAFCNGVRLHRAAAPIDPARWRGVTSRRALIGRALPGLAALRLTWVCCGVDYPHLIQGQADFILYAAARAWDHAPCSLLLTESGGYLGTVDGTAYQPQGPEPQGLIAAADKATYDAILRLI